MTDNKERDALSDLLAYAERTICYHEETHRGGGIWTICDSCGQKWADDEGGFQPAVVPEEIIKARAALAASQDKAEPVAWVAADTIHSPHPTCISSLAYMSQLDRERGREYVPLYAAPVAAQASEPANPSGYAYRYPDAFGGGTVIRFNGGEEVNGSRPIEAIPYWFNAPKPSAEAAIRTLKGLGYTYHGGQQWKPPLGDWKETVDRLNSLEAVRDAAYETAAISCEAHADELLPAESLELGAMRGFMLHQASRIRALKSAPPQPADAAQYVEALDVENHRLRHAMKKVMARLTNLLDEDQFGNIESIVEEAGVAPPQPAEQADECGDVVVTWDEDRTRILAVTRQDEDGRVLKIIALVPPVPPAELPSASYADCCDTPNYCSSVRRCTAKDDVEHAEQPSASPAVLTDEQIADFVRRADGTGLVRLLDVRGNPTFIARKLVAIARAQGEQA